MDVLPLSDPRLSRLPGLRHGFTLKVHGSEHAPGLRTTGLSALDGVLAEESLPWTRRQAIQVHGRACLVVGPDLPPEAPPVRADALVTAEPGELLVVRTADCLPVLVAAELFGEPVAVAAIHAGWRGLAAGVVEAALDELDRIAPGAQLSAALGPAIGPCCFEIGPEVAEALAATLGASLLRPGRGDRSHADLPAGARRILETREVRLDAGAPPCTRCAPDRFHSHRAAGDSAGRMAAYIGLVPA